MTDDCTNSIAVKRYLLDKVEAQAGVLKHEMDKHGLRDVFRLRTRLGRAWIEYSRAMVMAIPDADVRMLEEILAGMDKLIDLLPALARAESEAAED